MKNKKDDVVKKAGAKVIKKHAETFLRLRVIELERELASERVLRLQFEAKSRQLKHEVIDLAHDLGVFKYQLDSLLKAVDEYAGRPTKDGASRLKDAADLVRGRK